MTDRELLEFAAKAAGMDDWRWNDYSQCLCHYNVKMNSWYYGDYGDKIEWNPLMDDGDAFRLAVRMSIFSIYYSDEDWEICNHDGYSATRYAIVRSAAEIGKGMK